MDQLNDNYLNNDCLNCTMLHKELNLLRRKICLLNLQLEEFNSNPTQSNNFSNYITQGCQTELGNDQGCQTELFETETENDIESSSCSSLSPPTQLNLTHDLNLSLNDRLNVFSYDTVNQELVEPCTVVPDCPLENFDFDDLDKSTVYTKRFQNRLVAYYGDFPYEYEGAVHQSNTLSNNPKLVEILDKVKILLPDIKFNSALITKYPNGNFHLPYHSDKEESINEDSLIVTISLGQSRVIKFRQISDKGSELLINLPHGHMFTMSKKSQMFFEHSIPKDFSRQPRISVTLRDIKPLDKISSQEMCDVLLGLGHSPESQQPAAEMNSPIYLSERVSLNNITSSQTIPSNLTDVIQPQPQEKPITLYISSSMFRYLDGKRLSSDSQDSHVFFYPGATAGQMLKRFRDDPRISNINLHAVTRVMLMIGTNNVDSIARDPSGEMIETTAADILTMLTFIKSLVPAATINLVNVLPRKSYQRNIAVNQINNHLFKLSNQGTNVNFINTEIERSLFTTKQGFRKSFYFVPDSDKIYDNVHLNHMGISRLAKHLKYVAHNV